MPSATRTLSACLQSAERDAKQTTAEIIAEVDAKYQPRWQAAMARFDAARADEGNEHG